MPIFARTKMILEDDCFDVTVSKPQLSIKYSGPNPQLAYNKIKEMFREVFGLKVNERVQEKEFTWDRKGNVEKFKVKWEIWKDMDKFSYLRFTIDLSGYAEATEGGKEGEAKVEIDGVVRTEYPQDSLWERSVFYEIARMLWHKVVYHDKRQDYQDECRDMMMTFVSELKAFFNLLPERL